MLVRILDLPQENWSPKLLFEIVGGIDSPIVLDEATKNRSLWSTNTDTNIQIWTRGHLSNTSNSTRTRTSVSCRCRYRVGHRTRQGAGVSVFYRQILWAFCSCSSGFRLDMEASFWIFSWMRILRFIREDWIQKITLALWFLQVCGSWSLPL